MARVSQLRLRRIVTPAIFTIVTFFSISSEQKIHAQGAVSDNWSRHNLISYDSLWQYKPGKADPSFFSRDFNDEGWQSVNYQFLDSITPGTPAFKDAGVFRRKFFVPDSLKGKAVDLFFVMFGSCEIYFDGKPIYKKGKIGESISNYVVYQRTVPLYLDSLSWHVIAVYYGSSISSYRANFYHLRGLSITLVATQNKIGDTNDVYHHMLVSFGIIAGFALFFWFVFAFYPNRIASLTSALMLTNFSLIFLGSLLRDTNEPGLSRFIIGEKLWEIGFSTTFGWLLFFIYSAYYKKLRRYNLVVVLLILVIDSLVITENFYWFNIAVLFIALCVIESWRMIIKGLIKRKTGFSIIATGLLVSIVGTLTVIFNVFNVFPYYLTPTQTILGIANDLCFPLMLALHLAWEFGSANRDLRTQLLHVKELSDKSLLQEQEKQQLLASQNEMLEQQVTERTATLNKSLHELKSTQQQLIQSEKMASLGELTAGIAHEIQNPLNFVNNFSEINKEMVEEAQLEIDKGNYQDLKTMLNDIQENSEKINHHGKRADAIVKGMLQHSRQGKGVKEPTDINALCDEYLRLSYHGLRAKDAQGSATRSFYAGYKTDFDTSIGKINVISQDIGRVLLNVFNNAFYAVREKAASFELRSAGGFEPMVNVSTKKLGDRIEIRVTDNGKGIPVANIDKIFQPFFTTKPTGQGTGLGLSLSYDIIKAHGGQIKVSAKEGEQTEFIIELPLAQ